MLFDTPEVWLHKFTDKYCKKKSIAEIPYSDLARWRKRTQQTEGKYLLAHMSTARWGDSAKSLITAANVIRTSAPEFLESDESVLKLVVRLEHSALREIKRAYEAKHGKFIDQLKRPKEPSKQ